MRCVYCLVQDAIWEVDLLCGCRFMQTVFKSKMLRLHRAYECCRYDTMTRYPGHKRLEDVTLFSFKGKTIPFTHEDSLANCRSREEFQDTVRLMGALSREDPLLFSERFAPLPGLHLAT
jgi:hypothetical protein